MQHRKQLPISNNQNMMIHTGLFSLEALIVVWRFSGTGITSLTDVRHTTAEDLKLKIQYLSAATGTLK